MSSFKPQNLSAGSDSACFTVFPLFFYLLPSLVAGNRFGQVGSGNFVHPFNKCTSRFLMPTLQTQSGVSLVVAVSLP